jgi:hypothetical protein
MQRTVTAAPGELKRHLSWLISLLLLISFAMTDAAIVTWSAGLVSTGEVVASAFTFALISLGLLITVWEMDR